MNTFTELNNLEKDKKTCSSYWALVDAFDAVTNGMENPGADAELAASELAALEPWKALIGAIRSLYQEDSFQCAAWLARIATESPPGTLIPLFMTWMEHSATGRFPEKIPASVGMLYNLLFTEPHPIKLLAEQAEESLRHGMLEHYETAISRILKELQGQRQMDGSLLAVRYAQYCLQALEAYDIDASDYFSVPLRALGRSDGFFVVGAFLLNRNFTAAREAFLASLEEKDGIFMDGEMKKALTGYINSFDKNEQKDEKLKIHKNRPKNSKQLELF